MKALIIGAGIAGPVAALALRKAGIDATVFESHATPAEGIGGALMVAPNGLDALRVVGADEAVRAIGQPIRRMVLADGRGRHFGEFPALPGLPPSLVLWRSELHRVLHQHAISRGIRIEHSKRLADVSETSSEVAAHFTDGSSATADVLIGADGIRSTVRTLIDPAAPGPQYTGTLGFGGFAAGSAVVAASDAITFVQGKRAFLGYWAAPEGGIVWFSNLLSSKPLTMAQARRVPSADWLRALHEAYCEDFPGRELLAHSSAEQLFVLGKSEILPSIPHWHRGRMVLVGDSAHAPSSSSGQGASLSLESAVELARCLRDLPDVPSAFSAYERLRRPRVEKVAANAEKTNRDKVAGPVARAVMGVLMPIAMKTFLTPQKMFGKVHGHHIEWGEVAM